MRKEGPSRFALLATLLLAAPAAAQPLADANPEDVVHGTRVFEIHCARCHGLGGTGGEGPNLMRENLRRSTEDDALLEIVDNGIAGTDMPGHGSLNTREIRNVAAYVRSLGVAPREDLPGDPVAGKELYEMTLCSTCHIVNGEGLALGPDLSDVGLLRGSAHLRESIQDPPKVVNPRYRTVLIEDANTRTVMGVRVAEDTFTIQVIDEAGRHRSFRKSELREYQLLPEESMMMSYADFTDQELDDLVAYLATLRGPEGDPE
jgi:putative heme-binding domain-containing protein